MRSWRVWRDCVSGLGPKSVSLDALDHECTQINGKRIEFCPEPSWFLRLFKHLCVALLESPCNPKLEHIRGQTERLKTSWRLYCIIITTGWYCTSVFTLIIGLFVMAWLAATAQASLHTISLWFIWTLNLASLQPAIAPLGWDNWFCISHRDGWNNIQDGRDDRDLANLPAAPHFDLRRVLRAGQKSQFIRVLIVVPHTSV